ncbi:probable E3 ubiquitin-protein ligase HECTD4 isoform X2 [Engraulis encrasicolus]|uniref:probable E3 ubiquitin-protein ligase HECTD4 isoform X2 n=1 Tax=Engraulis encrasicolus TaxID=184585 RepID=UPI002FD52914
MGSGAVDSSQWLSVKEETIFLHDGLIRVTDLAELPSEIGVSEQGDTEQEILTFETKNPVELAERLRAVCGNQSNAYARLLEYRLNALRGLWGAQRQLALEEQQDRDPGVPGPSAPGPVVGSGGGGAGGSGIGGSSGNAGSDEEALALLKRQGVLHHHHSHGHHAHQQGGHGASGGPEQAPFTSRVGLLLLFPLLQSQTRSDPALCGVTAEVLLTCLRDCQPLSLGKEPADCLNGLEGLLCTWLEEGGIGGGVGASMPRPLHGRQRENAAAALVALACARGSLKTFIHTVHLLQKQTDLGQLPVADVLYRLLLLEGGPGSPSCLLGGKHSVSWGFEDMLPTPDSNAAGAESKDTDLGRCLATDGLYLYTTNSFGRGLSKLGSGLHGTLRGFVYCRNEELEPGWVVYSSGRLLHRPASFDAKPQHLCQLIDPHTLQVVQIVSMPPHHFPVGSSLTSLHLCSDGTYLYWVWCPVSLNEKTQKGHSVFMDVFQLSTQSGLCVVEVLQERVILSRKEGESSKCLNELLLSRMSRFRASHSATLAALTGSAITNPVKEEQSVVNTSCGLPLKTLRKTPMYVCGTYLVMVAPAPGVAGSSATRSLFGGTSGLSSLKILASSLVFNLADGQFLSRVDLIDAPGSSLGRGAQVGGLGACYDALNNLIWTCSSDYMDQWWNPGNQAFHHVCQRLGVSHLIREPTDEMVETGHVISQLLHHVGAMCIHQLNLLAAGGGGGPSAMPLGALLGKQHPMEARHFSSICDIMEKAMVNGDTCIIRCILVVFQVVFRFFNPQSEQNRESVRRAGLLLWQLLMAPVDQIGTEIQREVCLAISSGLNILYPGETDFNNLLKLVLTEGERNSGLSQLRDVILTNLSDQLQKNRFGSEDDDHYRLSDELLHYILKTVVRESCLLITKCQTVARDDFHKLLATVPVASPSLRYLMAVQNHLLSNTILLRPDDADDSDSSLQGETMKVQELQTSILSLATKILVGCDEVLETLQQVTTALINSDISDRDVRLKGLEQVTKATMLGHLLPVLLTSLMHPNLQTLTLADALMPQLVQLVLYTSQTALLLKTQSSLLIEGSPLESGSLRQGAKAPPTDDNLRILEEREEPGFLTGLKIPAPWAAGKTVETVHPVRDNYKFKETVHIPGARCLYLRFDPRCSSQYDYDKLVIYAGPNTNSRKVTEYGGNTLGYGSRSVLGTGWPKDLVKVEGDTVTFSFEMRSGREHNTPDKAMWGFSCTVRAQESSEDVSGGLPFLADLALGLSVLACSMLRILYNGPEVTPEEEACHDLLCSKLLQRCQWQVEANGAISPALTPSPSPLPLTIDEDREFTYPADALVPPPGLMPAAYCDLPRIRLPPGIMGRLRELSGRARPQFRPSIKEVIRPDVMEEVIVSCVIKHLMMVDALQSLVNFQYREEHPEEHDLLCKIMAEAFKKINAMQRQLQSVAELEQKWHNEVEEAHQGKLENNTPFFHDYHFFENKMKELELLCSLKEVPLDWSDLENVVMSLREKFFQEVSGVQQGRCSPSMVKTRALVRSLMNRTELLLHVTIAPHCRSLTTTPTGTPACKSVSDTKTVLPTVKQPAFLRSMSAPSDLEMIANQDLEFTHSTQRRRHHPTSHRSSSFTLLQSLAIEDNRDRPTYSVLLGQLFAFIGTTPDQAVSSSSFLAAAQTRWRRGSTRRQALVHMRELLTAAVRVGGVTHLVGPVTMVLQGGPRIEELTCGGMVEQVQEAFGETMTSVVSLCARYPIACANSIGMLCTIPYTRSEEQCLVRSGLVQLMDRLCSLSSQRESSSSEKQTRKQKVAAMAWAAFQVLANRCIEWEKVEGGSADTVHSGLARQVSTLLTNHLARATECCGNQAAGNDALQDVLSLLNDLSRSHIGKAILSQPACVSKLLSLLLDQRPSPKLVLIILQLCRAALPLMSVEDCGRVALPSWSYSIHALEAEQRDASDPASRIAALLLAKLADYVVPGCQTLLSPSLSDLDASLSRSSPKGALKSDKEGGEESEAVDGKLSIFIHKREDQSSHEVLQPLLSSSEGRPFRLGTGANMEKVVKMDRDMTKTGCCEVVTEEAAAALRKANKWAQSGLIVSVGPPVETLAQETSGATTTGDKKKSAQTAVCRDRNADLARSDPVRPFISGHVANSMAAEVIALLHSLLTAPESNTAQIWTSTAEKVLSRALMFIPQLGKYAESILESGSSSGRKLATLQAIGRQAVAALCALGGFKETIKIGSEVQVVGKGVLGSVGVVMSINEQEGIATVKFPSCEYRRACKASDVLTVPISRLCTPRSEALPLYKLSITEKVVQAVQSMLLPQEGSLSIHTSLPASGDGSSPVMAAVRLLAEIRTRACLVMAQLLEDSMFCEEFIQQCPAAVEVLNLVAQECSPGERLGMVESQCERLRMLYRDCARPPPPPLQTDRRQPKEITWCPSRVFPPVRACMFSSHLTSVTFLADPSAGGGLPRGTFIYATSPVPVQAPSFYWEIEIVSYGDSEDDSGPIVSFGFATEAEKRDGAWTNPVGTCLFHNNGRAVHYNGSSLLQWKSVRLDVALLPGDVAGIGWERSEGTPPPPGQPPKGRVYFTYCGQRLSPYLEEVAGGMWPLVHIQKKNTKIRANFGCRPFAYAEGQAHRNAADLCVDLSEEISANFEALPFAMASDSDNDAGTSVASDPGSQGPPCRIAAVATTQQQYNSDASCHYKVELSYENLVTSGPDSHPPPLADDESDDEDDEDMPREDHYALLVKAWETKVFPTIRRRFRNEAERKSGLDQIKGALQLGMVDIARQTVEFLYEENGGIPIYLPTIEDIKDEANKFTIDKVRKGLMVVIRCPDSNNTSSTTGGMALPKFAIRGMLKTFGLHGVVLDVDSVNELVQVETYLRSEGVLVRYWYPIEMLERPPAGSRRTAANGLVSLDSSNIQIHRELLRCESALARLYCRMALLNIFAPKSPHTFTRLFHIPAVRDITLEHLQLLSNQLLAPPLPDGTISSSSILLAQSVLHNLQGQSCSPTELFYQGNAQTISEWLTVAITRALHQGDDSLLDLTKQICCFLQNAPDQFTSEEFPVTESKVSMDVNFPGAAFVVVSCKESQQGCRKDSSLYKAPWARVLVYGLGHKVRRNGQLSLMEAVCYPLDASPSNTGLTPPPTTHQYPSIVIPTDKVHIKLGVSPPPGTVLVLHSLPLEFPLAMAFAEQLLTWTLGEGGGEHGSSDDEADTVPSAVLLQVVELLGGLLWTTDLAPCIKELLFHLLAELFRKIHQLEQRRSLGSPNPPAALLSSSIALLLNPCLAVLMALQSELRKLYDRETQGWLQTVGGASGGGGVGSGGSSGAQAAAAAAAAAAVALASEQSRFSTYFHALMEVCLAVAEVTLPLSVGGSGSGSVGVGGGGPGGPALTSSSAPNLSDSSSSSSSSPGQTPHSPSLLSKRKKVKLKRERGAVATMAAAASGKRGSGGAAHLSESDSALLNMAGGKPEDMLWFHRGLTLLIILRHLASKDPQGLSVTGDAVADACQALVGPTAHSRLLVISGVPTHLEESAVRSAIRRACNAHGGLFKDEIFIPLQDEDPKKPIKGCVPTPQDGRPPAERLTPAAGPQGGMVHVGPVMGVGGLVVVSGLGPRAESPDSSSSATPARSVTASNSASTSQTSVCSSSQGGGGGGGGGSGGSRTASELSVDQEPLPGSPAAAAAATGANNLVPPPTPPPPPPPPALGPGGVGHHHHHHPVPGQEPPHNVSSQESLDISLCSTGSLGSLGSLGEPPDSAGSDAASGSDAGSMYTVTSLDNNASLSRPIKGYAVIEVRARAKVEKIRASLFNSSDLIGLSSLEGEEELMEMTNEEILTASSVNQSLFDTQGSSALEDYFLDKTIRGDKLVPGARDVLTDIYKSCILSEQMLSLTPAKPFKVTDVYLSKEQINSQTPGNLLHVFFTHVRPPKKVLEDQLTQILRKYGTAKPNKSKYSKAGKEQHQGKVVSTKRAITKPPSKEKSVLNSVRTALSEKKPVLKPKSPEKARPDEKDLEKSPAKKLEVPEEKYLTLEGFHKFAVDRAKQDIRSVWRAVLACGYDLHFERCTCIDARHAQKASRKWSLEMDVALVQYINRLCRHLAITPARLHPHEVYLDQSDAADPRVACLLGVPVESLRLRFALLQSLNNTLESFFLPLVELRQTHTYQNSIAALLRDAKGLIFYDTKVTVMNRVLNATVQRTADHAAPEITLDPLEIVGGEIRSPENTYFCQAARQLATVPSSQLCVKLASGGDPTYAFNIRFTGEEVHGTSGSFRHFLWQVCKELQGSALSLLLPCPSAAANRNKGKFILTPCPISYAEEQLLHLLGQLLGIAIRADVPLPLDLLGSFWKGLVGEPLDHDADLQEADLLTYNYVKKFESVCDESELEALCAEMASQGHGAGESPDSPSRPCCTFTYITMTGEEVELCPGGRHLPVSWENKDVYARAVRALRMRELQSVECMAAVRAGLASIIPLQLLTMLSPLEMELRTCGTPHINLEFLKAHTMYQVGLMETDQHIEFFWTALEMFTQEELCKFIKFACNQERIPFTCPCKDGGPDTAHVPPYPMKIAPPDGTIGSPDSRFIRVETCMFMVKLPQYSSLDVMLEKLRYAIHYREDPLSG